MTISRPTRIAILAATLAALPATLHARPHPSSMMGPYPEADIAAARFRQAHANELLGKHFQGSIVARGQAIPTPDTNRFVMERMKKSLPSAWKPKAEKIFRTLIKEANRRQFDPIFLLAVIQSESSFNPTVRGKFSEIGLMQIKPTTARWISHQFGLDWGGTKTLFNPETNIRIGAAYLSHLRDQFDSHGRLYLAAYNMGGGNVRKALGRNIWPRDYAIRVMQHYLAMYEDLVEQLPETYPARETASD